MNNYDGCSPNALREKEIPDAMSRLRGSVNRTDELLGQIVSSIGPVLSPEPPTTDCQKDPGCGFSSQLALEIYESSNLLERINRALSEIISRIEV